MTSVCKFTFHLLSTMSSHGVMVDKTIYAFEIDMQTHLIWSINQLILSSKYPWTLLQVLSKLNEHFRV